MCEVSKKRMYIYTRKNTDICKYVHSFKRNKQPLPRRTPL